MHPGRPTGHRGLSAIVPVMAGILFLAQLPIAFSSGAAELTGPAGFAYATSVAGEGPGWSAGLLSPDRSRAFPEPKSLPAPTVDVVLSAPGEKVIGALRERNAAARVPQVGIGRDLVPGGGEWALGASDWRTLPDGTRTASIRVHSQGAAAVRTELRFDAWEAAVFVRAIGAGLPTSGAPGEWLSPTGSSWWTPPTPGESQRIDFFLPAGAPIPGRIVAGRLSHFVYDPWGPAALPMAKSCAMTDVMCTGDNSSELAAAMRASGRLTYQIGADGYVCSGTMLADTDPTTSIPYLHTAAHCFDRESAPFRLPLEIQAIAGTLVVNFRYWASSCLSSVPFYEWGNALGTGATVLHHDPNNDTTLLRLGSGRQYRHFSAGRGVHLLGWDATAVGAGTNFNELHHPGDSPLMKISGGTVTGVAAWAGLGGMFHAASYAGGIVGPGSSGSGMLTLAAGGYRLRGGLLGVAGDPLACPASGYRFSRLEAVFPQVAPWLAPPPSGGTFKWAAERIYNPAGILNYVDLAIPARSQFADGSCCQAFNVMHVPVQRVGGSSGLVTVEYEALPLGTASGHFTPTRGTLTWADGDATPKMARVQANWINPPMGTTPDTRFRLVLRNPSGGAGLVAQEESWSSPTELVVSSSQSTLRYLSPLGSGIGAVGEFLGRESRFGGFYAPTAFPGAPNVPMPVDPALSAYGFGTGYQAKAGTRHALEHLAVTRQGQACVTGAGLSGGAPGADSFVWHVDGVERARWSAFTLSGLCVDVPAGQHLFRFTFEKGISPDGGSGNFVTFTYPALAIFGDDDGDGLPNELELSFGRNPVVKDNDVFGSPVLFAMQQYRDFLGRDGDATGIGGWTSALVAGTYSRADVINAFFNSSEFNGFVAPVVRLYYATFLRVPDYAGLTYNAGLVRSGTVTLAQLADFFTASPEFQSLYGSLDNAQFVTLLYNNVLGRAPDAAGLSGWVALLNGGYTRGQVLLGFSDSSEYQARKFNEVYVTMMYVGMLRRSPEPAGYNGWLAYLNSPGNSPLSMINGFYLSGEYRGRFLP
jgi:hypothetical protein